MGDVEDLCSMLINGLYDDSDVAFVKGGGDYRITWSQDDPDALYEEELMEVAKAVQAGYDYYKDNSEDIEGWDIFTECLNKEHPHNIWRDLDKEGESVMAKYGWEPSDHVKVLMEASVVRVKALQERLDKRKSEER